MATYVVVVVVVVVVVGEAGRKKVCIVVWAVVSVAPARWPREGLLAAAAPLPSAPIEGPSGQPPPTVASEAGLSTPSHRSCDG